MELARKLGNSAYLLCFIKVHIESLTETGEKEMTDVKEELDSAGDEESQKEMKIFRTFFKMKKKKSGITLCKKIKINK